MTTPAKGPKPQPCAIVDTGEETMQQQFNRIRAACDVPVPAATQQPPEPQPQPASPLPELEADRLVLFKRVLAVTARGRKWTDEAAAELIAMVDTAQARVAELEAVIAEEREINERARVERDELRDRVHELEQRLAEAVPCDQVCHRCGESGAWLSGTSRRLDGKHTVYTVMCRECGWVGNAEVVKP